ncbi:Hemolysin-type calcium-binding repeat (2 copies) family protein [Rhizobium leguminosarum]|uniref:Hemolysin-type calcium-binding repeat (2 copies) family protein n=1 Tax=Rhizobium leguminosarum TaxID=384 RepID=A0A2Z4YJH6_RHILE|nr:Hemolysin-type calcium-binding repeat (2 copies) family protein [Rhizobium leguminosarum]
MIENVQAGSGDDTIVGNEANNTLWGNAGNDSLSGGTGVDTLIGGTGNDTYFVDNAADVVTENASEGTDTVRATASYTLGANVENLTFIGTGAFSGIGNGLDNTITGGAATDTLLGGAGNDTLDGGAGADTLLGGAGDDTYIVDNASDSVTENASEGTDMVRTNLASYTLGANVENLTYNGTAAFAGTGNSLDNLIIGGAASDTLSGGAGNDTLNGSAGADTLLGGAGDDIYAVDNAGDSVTESAAAGTDMVRTNLASYTLGANVENLTYNGTAAFAGTGNSLDNLIIGGAASDTLSGGAGNDTLNGSAGADTLLGGAGDDIYAVDNAGDSVTESAAAGTDMVRTNLASYTLGANVENLTYNGTATFAGTGNDLANTIRGAAGADTLDGKAGADILIGGAGNDTYIVADLGDVVTEGLNEGTDLIRTVLSSYALTNIANVENLTFIGTGDFSGTGNSLANTITGGAGNDTLDGGAGNDTLIGGAGNDIYVVDSASDVVTEAVSDGTDEIRTVLSNYTLGNNVETLTYTGSASFTGIGNALDNTISGGAGNDTLNGSAGADTLLGGAGDDIYAVDNAGDSVTESAAAGTDMVRTNLASYTLGANVENLTYNGTATFAGTGNDLANTIRGAAGADTLDGKAGADILIGGAGNDTYIVADLGDVVTEGLNEGTDLIRTVLSSYALTNIANVENLTFIGTGDFSGTGNSLANTITGGAGNDTLDGGAGNDTLIGGAGNDIYVVDSASDVVTEAVSDGTDEIRTVLSNYTLGNNVETLTYTGSASFTGIGNALDNTISGGAGNDTLNGSAGADTLLGGAGDDIYAVDNAGDSVTESAAAGTDMVRTNLASYTLGANVENLTYNGTATFAGTGNDLANTIRGAAGADTLDGKAGADILIGGAGNDTYIVADLGDVVTEGLNEGTDLIRTVLSSYALTNIANVENLTFIGTGDFSGTGNSLANTITGGAGNDTLDGGAGNDTLIGGAGNDIYVVDSASDVVTEAVSDGTDEIRTVLSNYTLGNNVETLTYTGSASFTGIGNALDNTISGGAGNDTLNGSAGADTLLGGAGDDIYAVDNAGDSVTESAAAGTDMVRTNLASYTLGANVENLTYNGTATFAGTGNDLANTIRGAAGADTLDGKAGADILIGGAGNDTYIVADLGDVVTEGLNEGTDLIRTVLSSYALTNIANVENLTFIGTGDFSGTGNSLANTITGGAGNDTLDGGAGNDTLIGGAGNDIYVVDSASDVVTEAVSDGTDEIRTVLSNYTLGNNVETLTYTGSASFTGIGNALDNTITGGAGNDTLNGSAGADTLIGGAGDDIYAVDNAGDSVTESAAAGTDMVRTNLASYTLGANVENLTYNGTATFAGTGNSLDNLIIGGAASDTLSGGAGNDTLNGSAGADTLLGGAGDDIYAVDNAGDSVTESAAAGTDMVRTNLASYTLGANVENLTYNGTATFAGTGNDLANTIRGAAGADTLDGKAGADILIGGAGNDTYIVADLGDVVTEGLNEGTDLIRTVLSSYALTNIANVENLTFIGTGDFSGTGNSLANTITGGAGNDTLDGGAGNDTLIGGAGNDIYVVDSASDVVTEAVSDGTDEIRTVLSNYTLGNNVETLTYTGSASFTGIGNALDNTITGGAGNDTLNGSAGADTLIGGAGDDIYAVDNAGDSVTESAAAGTDMVRTNLASYTLGANVENLTYNGTATFAGTGNSLDNLIIGGAASDTLSGGAGNDTLNGSAGADTLIGGAGDDIYAVDNAGDSVTESAAAGTDMVRTNLASYTLGANVENLTYNGTAAFAGTGNSLDNLITGGNGGNTLTGGAGDDILIGGAAADFFIYSPNWGHDTITNFVATGTAHDTIRIDHSVFADWASLLAASSQSGSDTIVTADINNTITLKNVAVSSLESSDFQFA